ncbi:hypothetical protein D3C87_299750 [compost metagenome]
MRQLIKPIMAFVLMAPSLSWSLSDPVTQLAAEKIQAEIQADKTQFGRMEKLSELKQFVNHRLNTIELPPDLLKVRDDDPILESFRSLNEFEGYLDLISMTRIHGQNCAKAEIKVLAATAGKDSNYVSPEAQVALDLLKSICSK